MTTIAIIVALLILWAIFRNKQERPKPNQESQAATKPMAPTKVKTKPVVSNADLDDSYVKFSIVGCQFYKENIVGFQHRSFHDAKLIETTYKGEYAVRVEIKGKQVGNIAKDNLPLVLKHIHDQDNEIRVIAFVDDNPSVKMCKLEVEESDFDLELVADTSSVLRMPGKLICMDSSNEEIYILLEDSEHDQGDKVKILFPIDAAGSNGKTDPAAMEDYLVFQLDKGPEFDNFVARGYHTFKDTEHDNYNSEVRLTII